MRVIDKDSQTSAFNPRPFANSLRLREPGSNLLDKVLTLGPRHNGRPKRHPVLLIPLRHMLWQEMNLFQAVFNQK